MRIDGPWAPFVAVLGGTRGSSFVDVEPGQVRFRFGWGFDQRIARRQIVDAHRTRWPWYCGIGWRICGRRCVGLIGSWSGVVEVALRKPRRVRIFGLPYTCHRIAVSLQDPEAFLAELGREAPPS